MENLKEFYDIELRKLAKGLDERGIPYVFHELFDGYQIVVNDENEHYAWDAICHSYSYGHKEGKLEIMGDIVSPNAGDSVEGYLTAEDILERL